MPHSSGGSLRLAGQEYPSERLPSARQTVAEQANRRLEFVSRSSLRLKMDCVELLELQNLSLFGGRQILDLLRLRVPNLFHLFHPPFPFVLPYLLFLPHLAPLS